MTLVTLLITVIVFALVCYILFWALGYLGAPEPVRKVLVVIVVLIAVIWLLGYFMPGTLNRPLHW